MRVTYGAARFCARGAAAEGPQSRPDGAAASPRPGPFRARC